MLYNKKMSSLKDKIAESAEKTEEVVGSSVKKITKKSKKK